MFTYFRRKTCNVEAHGIPHVLTYPSHIVEVTIFPSYPRCVGFYTSKKSKDVLSQSIMTFAKKKSAVWNMNFIFPFSWECHDPNWRTPSFFRGVSSNHQPGNHCLTIDFSQKSLTFPGSIPFIFPEVRLSQQDGAREPRSVNHWRRWLVFIKHRFFKKYVMKTWINHENTRLWTRYIINQVIKHRFV